MSQPDVERVIGRLLTDESFRRRFRADPVGTLEGLEIERLRLNPCELQALAGLDFEAINRFVDRLDPRLQKSDLRSPTCQYRVGGHRSED